MVMPHKETLFRAGDVSRRGRPDVSRVARTEVARRAARVRTWLVPAAAWLALVGMVVAILVRDS